ncbi:DsrE family protein [Algoriphagus algorifonticola]|uniref:DsrE family protein n=1 Tax=Algoriphagus algorifonticola TaxID=2593007 RepID=UPI0011A92B48|nr:DsrE family protein [Algoriphagus algorifonticola]
MKKHILSAAILFLLLGINTILAQTAQFPIVKGFGGIYEIPEATERPDGSLEYKILVDLTAGADNPAEISRWVDNIARMMNLHGLAGVTKDRLHVKVVVHGGAIFTLLNDDKHQVRYESTNPNLAVYEALKEAGAEFYVCGQSMVARNIKKEDLWQGVQIAHSALTTITTYVPQGYILLKF